MHRKEQKNNKLKRPMGLDVFVFRQHPLIRGRLDVVKPGQCFFQPVGLGNRVGRWQDNAKSLAAMLPTFPYVQDEDWVGRKTIQPNVNDNN